MNQVLDCIVASARRAILVAVWRFVVWNRKVAVAAIVLMSICGCSAEPETPGRDLATQSAQRTVAYLSDAQRAVLVEQIRPVVPDVQIDADRVSEAMRSTCVAILDEVPSIERAAAVHLTAGLQTDLSEEAVSELMHIAGAQEWCRR